MMNVLFSSIFLVLLTVLVLVSPAASSSENDFCTEDNCPEGTELIEIEKSSVVWWSPYSVGKYLISLMVYQIQLQAKRVYNKAADVVEGVKSKIKEVGDVLYNQIAKLVEKFYNKTSIVVEQVYNKAADVVEGVKSKIKEVGDVLYNQIAKLVEKFYNKTSIVVEQAYNKTAEFAGRVYKKIEEYAEVVRNVLREEFNSFFEIIWDDDSLRENGMFCP